MTDQLTATADRLDEVTIMFERLGADARARLTAAVLTEAIEVARIVVEEKLSGQVLNARSNGLRNSVRHEIADDSSGVMAVVGANTPYARIHEYGGTIVPVVANALRFFIGGKMIIAKSVTMPERSYLRSTLAEQQEEIRRALTAAVAGAE